MKKSQTTNLVTLVDKKGNPTGYAEKIEAHLLGALHLAFSLMIVRTRQGRREYLLQRRAIDKYHSGGLWANTCCSHPFPDESIDKAAHRRVSEELGINNLPSVTTIGQIYYKHTLDNNMIEHEYDNIVVTEVDDIQWQQNPDEVMAVKWWHEDEIDKSLAQNSSVFAAWFPDVFNYVKKHSPAPQSISST
jgi:isopentenyl-diphosphate delta-isomerase